MAADSVADLETANSSVRLPEITLKALILGIILAIVLSASNAYLGLKAGVTISASIPAAVVSMAVLRFFRDSNVLENNIVQTAASAGEALTGGMIYITPVFLVLGFWKGFNYWDCVCIALGGAGLGVVCSIPVRRVLLSNPHLPYPEGVAIGNVLRASMNTKNGVGVSYLVSGGIVGAIFSFAQSGLEVLANGIIRWGSIGATTIGYGTGFYPALIAAGYIVGVEVGVSLLIGTILGSLVCVPILSHIANPTKLLGQAFFDQVAYTDIRYIGLGIMLLGGMVTIFTLFKPLVAGIKTALGPRAEVKGGAVSDRDLSGKPLIYLACIFSVICFVVIGKEFIQHLPLPLWYTTLLTLAMGIICLVACFVACCLGSYFSGLVGATNNPFSAITLSILILFSFMMLLFLGNAFASKNNILAASMVVVVAAIVSCAGGLNLEVIQDLKAGQMVGATPWKQQVMLILGGITAAFVVPLILRLLFNAYGIAGIYPHAGMDQSQNLTAPQASMMALVVQTVFAHNLPWRFIFIGFAITIACLLANLFFNKRNMNISVMAVGIGVYLPLDANTPMVLGAAIAYLAVLHERKLARLGKPVSQGLSQLRHQRSLLLSCGLVAGSALIGVLLAIPFVIYKSTDALAIVSDKFAPTALLLAIVLTLGLLGWMYYVAIHSNEPK